MKYYIIATGYNCLPYAKKCYGSLLNLGFDRTKWEAVLFSDGSTDGTSEYVKEMNKKDLQNISGVTCHENFGAAFCRHVAIKALGINDEDVVVLLGLDDELKPSALTEIDKQYKAGKWMTYGNWIDQHGKGLPAGFELDFDEETHKSRDYRKVTYRSTAPNTFKYFLYKNIQEDDLKINGKWIDSTTESEVMFSCLEQSGKDRIGIIREPIYLYNRDLPGGTLRRLGKEYKYEIYNQVIARPKKPQLFR